MSQDNLSDEILHLFANHILDIISDGSIHHMAGIGWDIDGKLLITHRALNLTLKPGPLLIIRDGQFLLNGERT